MEAIMTKRIVWFVLGILVGVTLTKEIIFWKEKAIHYVSKQYEHLRNKY